MAEPRNLRFEQAVRDSFALQQLMATIGARLTRVVARDHWRVLGHDIWLFLQPRFPKCAGSRQLQWGQALNLTVRPVSR